MDYQTLLVEDRGRVRWITFNRPDKLNALNRSVLVELDAALTEAASAAGVGALVLTGSGEKAFVAGADIAEFSGLDAAGARELARRGQRLFGALEASPKPVIAAVNGFALGGGCELAMACHLRVASGNARFGQPEVKLGLIAGYGGTQRLARLVGRGRALEVLLTGAMIDAATAQAWGLVNRVVEPAVLRDETQKLAESILAVSPAAVGLTLAAVGHGLSLPLEAGLELEAELFGRAFTTEDAREGIAAFLAKRNPSFPGR